MLEQALLRARRASDLTAVFVALGYRAADAPYDHEAVIRARWRGFHVVAADATAPKEAARALAHRLAVTGDRGLAACIGAGALAVAAPRAGTGTATRALLVDCAAPTAFALEQLRALGPGRSRTALSHALHVAEVLSAEAIGEGFFRAFRRGWEAMAASLPDSLAAADRRFVALQALTRVLFLYFVQAKGWLDGNPAFLRTLLDATLARRGEFHRRALDPLFFGTLNRPPERRGRRRFAGIPYLNGGLFERHPTERRLGPVHFADRLWIDAFESLFDRYRFCVREADEVDAVAPDMLGRVFERLMEPEDRSHSGTFFTPESIVREIVDATLAAALTGVGKLPADTVERLAAGERLDDGERTRASAALRRLRVLDLAVGSGAFLLGTLDALTAATSHLVPSTANGDRWRLRRRILRDNLFGVDINPVAVRLAELRLWLSVVAEDPAMVPAAVEPLPNLDGVVRQGNTLFDPVAAARAWHPHAAPIASRFSRQVAEARRALFDARGHDAVQAAERLRRRETDLARAVLDRAIGSGEHALRDLDALARGHDLFGRRNRLSDSQLARLRAVRASLDVLRRARARVEEGTLPFFAFDVHTPDVLAAGGFDVVLGNPPWVRAERLDEDERRQLRLRFRLWRADGERGFRHLPDLSVAFLERALELTREGGAVGFLVPSKLASAGYGEAVRRHMVRETTITCLHRVPDSEARRFGATTYPLAVVLRRAAPDGKHTIRLGLREGERVPQRDLEHSGPWALVPHRTHDAVVRLQRSGRPLREIAVPHLGVKTGADGLLVGRVVARSPRGWEVEFRAGGSVTLEPEVLRPALRGRDVVPFAGEPARVVVWAYTPDGEPLAGLPPLAAAYVARHRGVLERRADHRAGPPWVLFRTRPARRGHRVVWSDIARKVSAAVVEEATPDAVPLNTCYVAAFPDRPTALAASAVLNSSWATALATLIADEARGGYRRCNARVVGSVPLPASRAATDRLAGLALDAHRGMDVPTAQIDRAVAEALRLPGTVQAALRAALDVRG
jgi:hypothetical protein